ncbi:MAG: TlpA family protein disulfide reductase [Salinivirgaceae bacterium]|nr:TlpA family protein disulfide reductase [Salinivirgaceae bacterium]
MTSVFKNYFQKKSKFGLAIDILIGIMIIFLIIPATRKDMAALILKPTLFIHQPKLIKKRVAINPATYNWRLMQMDGTEIELNQFKDKVLFINFWATWCPPCIAEMPQLQKLYESYGDKAVFLFVSNEELPLVEQFIKSKEFTLPVYIPITQYPTDFDTNSLPTTFIVSKKGELVLAKYGVAQWNSKRIHKILDKLVEE